ncbi:hypothetical protein [Blastopirellula marina]|uniref:Uncharacterized protein n=1 Tax=Blastopirellula marina TaxID=124 RepID=A0A2S8F6P9_9BACT|nr:hypothetical protein [Blastopirellula marina]PQO27825.1 hypothetical protein C5Y98_26205 [Blastopirellula marina]PTL41560.1 hypothetical protein C5Y97_26220 [Blastopirellula marina]
MNEREIAPNPPSELPGRQLPTQIDATITTFLVMGIGILISIFGVAGLENPYQPGQALLTVGLGATLIVGQYVGFTRHNRVCLAVVNGILGAMTLMFMLLIFAVPPLFLLFFATSAVLLMMNWNHRRLIIAQERAGIPRPESAKITLRELLGAFVVLALILGPAKILRQMMDA